MRKVGFNNKLLPYLLIAPQIVITFVFFYWPAVQAVWQSFQLQDAFGLRTEFVWFDNYRDLFRNAEYYRTMGNTLFFAAAVTTLSLSIALFTPRRPTRTFAAPVSTKRC